MFSGREKQSIARAQVGGDEDGDEDDEEGDNKRSASEINGEGESGENGENGPRGRRPQFHMKFGATARKRKRARERELKGSPCIVCLVARRKRVRLSCRPSRCVLRKSYALVSFESLCAKTCCKT